MPVIWPVPPFNDSPGGKLPDVTVQVSGATPPCVAIEPLYIPSSVAAGSGACVTESVGGGAIIMMKTWLTGIAPPLSVTWIVNVEVPEPHGVPTIVPVVLVDVAFNFK